MRLPAGFTFRPPVPGDAEAVAAIVAASDIQDSGEPDADLQDILNDWRRPSFDMQMDAVLVLNEHGTPVAEAEIFPPETRAEVSIHPDYRGRGFGPALLRWTESRAAEAGCPKIGQTRSDTAIGAVELFMANGYEPLWKSWVIAIVHEQAPEQAVIPEGIRIRTYTDHDAHEVYDVIETAFSEWPDGGRWTFEDWSAWTLESEMFDPSMMLLATLEDTGEIVGAIYCMSHLEIGYIQSLAVKREHRNQGIAKALLRTVFGIYWEAGKPKVELSTDSRTGALGLYEHVGMHVERSYTRYSKDL